MALCVHCVLSPKFCNEADKTDKELPQMCSAFHVDPAVEARCVQSRCLFLCESFPGCSDGWQEWQSMKVCFYE